MGGRNLSHFKTLFSFLFAALTNFYQKQFLSINTKCCLGWLLVLQHEKGKTDIITKSTDQNPIQLCWIWFMESNQLSLPSPRGGLTSKPTSQPASKQTSNLLAVLTPKKLGHKQNLSTTPVPWHESCTTTSKPVQRGVLKDDSFCAQSNCYLCGRRQWEDRVSIPFIVVAPPEWSNYICIMDSVTPLLPCLAWQASSLIYFLVTEGGMMESFCRVVGLCSSVG